MSIHIIQYTVAQHSLLYSSSRKFQSQIGNLGANTYLISQNGRLKNYKIKFHLVSCVGY